MPEFSFKFLKHKLNKYFYVIKYDYINLTLLTKLELKLFTKIFGISLVAYILK